MSLAAVERRIKKIEAQLGINEPCPACKDRERLVAQLKELDARFGISSPKPRRADLIPLSCLWCLRSITVDTSWFLPDERAIFERWEAVYHSGLLCAPESEALHAELKSTFETVDRRKYGEHYDAYRAFFDESAKRSEVALARRAPKWLYLCRLPGCQCEYPKTEEEARANVRANLEARAA